MTISSIEEQAARASAAYIAKCLADLLADRLRELAVVCDVGGSEKAITRAETLVAVTAAELDKALRNVIPAKE